jgi:hypothetical protein
MAAMVKAMVVLPTSMEGLVQNVCTKNRTPNRTTAKEEVIRKRIKLSTYNSREMEDKSNLQQQPEQ